MNRALASLQVKFCGTLPSGSTWGGHREARPTCIQLLTESSLTLWSSDDTLILQKERRVLQNCWVRKSPFSLHAPTNYLWLFVCFLPFPISSQLVTTAKMKPVYNLPTRIQTDQMLRLIGSTGSLNT